MVEGSCEYMGCHIVFVRFKFLKRSRNRCFLQLMNEMILGRESTFGKNIGICTLELMALYGCASVRFPFEG